MMLDDVDQGGRIKNVQEKCDHCLQILEAGDGGQ